MAIDKGKGEQLEIKLRRIAIDNCKGEQLEIKVKNNSYR